MKYAVLLLAIGAMAWAKKDSGPWVPPDLWTHVGITHCKQVASTRLHCEADIDFAGFTITKPESNHYTVPRSKFEQMKPIIDKEHSLVALVDCDNYLLGGAQIYEPALMQRCPART